MRKSYYIIAAVLALVITTGIVSLTVFAGTGGHFGKWDKSAYMEGQNEYKQSIIDNNYDAWAEIMQEKVDAMIIKANELKDTITLETFANLVEVQALMEAGDFEGAKALMGDFGMGGFDKFKGMKKGFHMGWKK